MGCCRRETVGRYAEPHHRETQRRVVNRRGGRRHVQMSWRDTLVREKVPRANEDFGLREVGLPRGSRHVRHQSVNNEVAARVKCDCRVEELSEMFATDLGSSNGTYVRFGRQSESVTLRRGSCTLHGRGVICLGVSPSVLNAPTVTFEILRFDDTDPQPI